VSLCGRRTNPKGRITGVPRSTGGGASTGPGSPVPRSPVSVLVDDTSPKASVVGIGGTGGASTGPDDGCTGLGFGSAPKPPSSGRDPSLIRPLVGSERPTGIVGSLGSPLVPVPLRTHPPVPLMRGQSAGPTYTDAAPPTLAQAAQWTFGLLYSHEHAEQDEILLAVTFNIHRPLQQELFAAKLDLAASLAKYVLLGDRLRALMTAYLDAADPRQEVRDAVATTVADLVGDVAAAWDSHWPAQQIVAAAVPQTDLAEGTRTTSASRSPADRRSRR
jgi:hypothetical protein